MIRLQDAGGGVKEEGIGECLEGEEGKHSSSEIQNWKSRPEWFDLKNQKEDNTGQFSESNWVFRPVV